MSGVVLACSQASKASESFYPVLGETEAQRDIRQRKAVAFCRKCVNIDGCLATRESLLHQQIPIRMDVLAAKPYPYRLTPIGNEVIEATSRRELAEKITPSE